MEEIDVFVKVIGGMAGLSGLAFGLYQYRRGQLWKKSEFAASQLELLWKDDRIRFCCLTLDWSKRRFNVPTEYSCFSENQPSFVHDYDVFANAMTLEAEGGFYRFPQVYYRDCFDRFFEYLSNINHYIDIGLFTVKDITPLKYWLDQIEKPRFTSDYFLIRFIISYEYKGVLRLAEKMRNVQ
jgi:hypothetical protein